LTLRHLRELLRQPWYVAITLVQPVIWLLLFGELYKRVVEIPGFADIWRSPVARSRRVDRAQIFGEATIDGSGSFHYRIDVDDRGEPGTSDKYWIVLSNGYTSGNQTLVGGNVQIH
jgi:hypothetical protein